MHDLVFDAERVFNHPDYLDRMAKGSLAAISPDEVAVMRMGGAETYSAPWQDSCS